MSAAPDRAGRYRVQFSDGSVQKLYRQTVEDYALYSGMELSDREYEKLLKAAGQMSAKMRAVRIVSASNVSQKDLEQRLIHKGESPEDAKQAVHWMKDLQLVDDQKTADHIVARCISKGYGAARARQALYEKQIPKEYWDAALQDYPDQGEAILAFLQNRLDGKQQDAREIRRATDALIRRGHHYQEIRRALQQLSAEEFPEEE